MIHCKTSKRSVNHGREIGSSSARFIEFGPLRLTLERQVGVYGIPETVSYTIRFWRYK